MAYTFNVAEVIERLNEKEFTFPLYALSTGHPDVTRIKARRLTIADKTDLGHLPDTLQQQVWKRIANTQKEARRIEREVRSAEERGEEADTMAREFALSAALVERADAYCVAGWVEPKTCFDEASEDLEDGLIWIGRFPKEDRISYWLACQDATGAHAKRFASFRQQRERVVSTGEDGKVSGGSTVRSRKRAESSSDDGGAAD